MEHPVWGLGTGIKWESDSLFMVREPFSPQCHAICTPLCTGGENTVRETQRVPWLTETAQIL